MDNEHEVESFSFESLKEKWKKHDIRETPSKTVNLPEEFSRNLNPATIKRISASSQISKAPPQSVLSEIPITSQRIDSEVTEKSLDNQNAKLPLEKSTYHSSSSKPVVHPTLKRGFATHSLQKAKEPQAATDSSDVLALTQRFNNINSSINSTKVSVPNGLLDKASVPSITTLKPQASVLPTARPIPTPYDVSDTNKIIPSSDQAPVESNPFEDENCHVPLDDNEATISSICTNGFTTPNITASVTQDVSDPVPVKPKKIPPPPPPARRRRATIGVNQSSEVALPDVPDISKSETTQLDLNGQPPSIPQRPIISQYSSQHGASSSSDSDHTASMPSDEEDSIRLPSAPILPPRPILGKTSEADWNPEEIPKPPPRRSSLPRSPNPLINDIPKPTRNTITARHLSAPAPPLPIRPRHDESSKVSPTDTEKKGHESMEEHRVHQKLPSSEPPNLANANRRPPFPPADGRHQAFHKGVIKSFAFAGVYACTGVHVARVFDMRTGENVRTVPYYGSTEVKITAMNYSPTLDPAEEGRYLWCGMHDGNIWMMDVWTGVLVEKRGGIHSNPICFILRYKNLAMWTIDDGGTMMVWKVDQTVGRASIMGGQPRRLRVPSKQSHALVVGECLWMTNGNQIEILKIMEEGSNSIPSRSATIEDGPGLITAITMRNEDNLVYTANDRGNVSVWSTTTPSRVMSVNISSYAITTMCTVGKYLWVGFNTGMIYVYDPTELPWQVLKVWKAHQAPVQQITVDITGLATTGNLLAASLGNNGHMRVWDGTMCEDWEEEQMRKQQAEYCSYRDLHVLICSWNIDACKPVELEEGVKKTFLKEWLTTIGSPDIISIGIQEIVDLESKKHTARSFFSQKKKSSAEDESQQSLQHRYKLWHDRLIEAMTESFNERYTHVKTEHLVGLFSCIFIKESEYYRLKDRCVAVVKTGLKGLHGNKGGIAIRFRMDHSSICFVNCHLAAGQNHYRERNDDVATILDTALLDALNYEDVFVHGGDGSNVTDHEICFFSGDLNYRIDLPRDKVINAIKEHDWESLLKQDQLNKESARNPTFRLRYFKEAQIAFAPTYKYDPHTDSYDTSEKNRCPAWCDRILYRGHDIKNIHYNRHECNISDHRPISGGFIIKVKTIDEKKRAEIKHSVDMHWAKAMKKKVQDASIEYLVQWGFDTQEVLQALENCKWNVGEAGKLLRKA